MLDLATTLVFASAAVHAGWNAAVKHTADPDAAIVGVVGGSVALSALLGFALGETLPSAASWPWVAASGAIEAVYFLSLTRALSRLPLSTAYGIGRGGGQLVTWPLSVALQGERPSGQGLLGAALVVAGLAIGIARPVARSGLAWALLCAFTVGLYPLTYRQALAAGAPPCTLFAISMAMAWPVQVAALGPTRSARIASAARPITLALAAAGCTASFLFFLLALQLDHAGRASALRNVSIVFATLLAAALGERVGPRTLLGSVLIALGAAALATSG